MLIRKDQIYFNIDTFKYSLGEPYEILDFVGMDNPKHWIKNVDRDYTKKTDFNYKLNKQGFRSANNFDENYNYGLLFAGDSFTLGEGLPLEDLFSYKISKFFKIPHLSLGYSGASSKKISLLILSYINNFRVDSVFALYPTFTRSNLLKSTSNNNYCFLNDTQINDNNYRKLYKVLGTETLIFNYVQDILLTKYYCDFKNIKFKWSTWDYDLTDKIKYFPNDLQNTFIPGTSYHDFRADLFGSCNNKARDGMYPGKKYNECIFDILKKEFDGSI